MKSKCIEYGNCADNCPEQDIFMIYNGRKLIG